MQLLGERTFRRTAKLSSATASLSSAQSEILAKDRAGDLADRYRRLQDAFCTKDCEERSMSEIGWEVDELEDLLGCMTEAGSNFTKEKESAKAAKEAK